MCMEKRTTFNNATDSLEAENKSFNKGSMIIYRYQITCKCDHDKKCARVLSKPEQGWAEYMGSHANGNFNKRPKRRF